MLPECDERHTHRAVAPRKPGYSVVDPLSVSQRNVIGFSCSRRTTVRARSIASLERSALSALGSPGECIGPLGKAVGRMLALGHSLPLRDHNGESALPPKATRRSSAGMSAKGQ